MKSQIENRNQLLRETFEASEEKRYTRTIREMVARLDGFNDDEAIALLESAKALIALRKIWRLTGNESVKDHGRE